MEYNNEPIYFNKLSTDAVTPKRGTKYSAGFDLYATKDILIDDCGNYRVPTDLAVMIPRGYYGRLAMRSGLAVREHLCVSAGVIDSDYRGPIDVVVFTSKPRHDYIIAKGERFAQLIIERISMAPMLELTANAANAANYTPNTHGGFGSTGKF